MFFFYYFYFYYVLNVSQVLCKKQKQKKTKKKKKHAGRDGAGEEDRSVSSFTCSCLRIDTFYSCDEDNLVFKLQT